MTNEPEKFKDPKKPYLRLGIGLPITLIICALAMGQFLLLNWIADIIWCSGEFIGATVYPLFIISIVIIFEIIVRVAPNAIKTTGYQPLFVSLRDTLLLLFVSYSFISACLITDWVFNCQQLVWWMKLGLVLLYLLIGTQFLYWQASDELKAHPYLQRKEKTE